MCKVCLSLNTGLYLLKLLLEIRVLGLELRNLWGRVQAVSMDTARVEGRAV
jgi:hypothetical protein